MCFCLKVKFRIYSNIVSKSDGVEFGSSFLLFAAGSSADFISVYHRPGHDAVLPCFPVLPSDTSCSDVNWLYDSAGSDGAIREVLNGKVSQNSARAARLSLNPDCSLVLNNITALDVGWYICQWGMNNELDRVVGLRILTGEFPVC